MTASEAHGDISRLMNAHLPDRSFKKYKKNSYKLISNAIILLRNKEYSRVKEIVNKKIFNIKSIVKPSEGKPDPDPAFASFALVIGVFFKGLEEFSAICEICDNNNWLSTPEAVEQVWFLLQNCKERFSFCIKRSPMNFKALEYIVERVNQIECEIDNRYGSGLYTSPEVIIEKCRCSICGSDYRKCEHIGNRIYGGKLCLVQPTDIRPGICVVILEKPHDLRCRIWPWTRQNTEDGPVFKNVPLLFSFSVDEFLFSDDPHNVSLRADFKILPEVLSTLDL